MSPQSWRATHGFILTLRIPFDVDITEKKYEEGARVKGEIIVGTQYVGGMRNG